MTALEMHFMYKANATYLSLLAPTSARRTCASDGRKPHDGGFAPAGQYAAGSGVWERAATDTPSTTAITRALMIAPLVCQTLTAMRQSPGREVAYLRCL